MKPSEALTDGKRVRLISGARRLLDELGKRAKQNRLRVEIELGRQTIKAAGVNFENESNTDTRLILVLTSEGLREKTVVGLHLWSCRSGGGGVLPSEFQQQEVEKVAFVHNLTKAAAYYDLDPDKLRELLDKM